MTGIWQEWGGRTQGWGKLLGESQVECHFVGFPRGRLIIGVWEVPGAPQKPKWAASTITKPVQKLENIKKKNRENVLSHSFPLGPRQLAQKREKHPKPMKPCSTSGFAENAKI